MKDTVINIVAGLGLISFITMFCDFIMLNYVSERKIVGFFILTRRLIMYCSKQCLGNNIDKNIQIKQKKFEVLDRRMMFSGLMALVSVTSGMANGRQDQESSAQVEHHGGRRSRRRRRRRRRGHNT